MSQPVLLHYKCRDSGKKCAHEAVEGPPVVLEDQASKNDQAAQGVVDEHHLRGSAQDPVQQLEKEELLWKTELEHTQTHTKKDKFYKKINIFLMLC